jgi:tetratricopeptide (TPR) repeat protein
MFHPHSRSISLIALALSLCIALFGQSALGLDRSWLSIIDSARRAQAGGDYASAERLYQSVLTHVEKSEPDIVRTPFHAMLLNNIALVYQAEGRYSEAESAAKESLAILNSSKTPNLLSVANALGTLAGTYRVQGRHKEAEDLLLNAVAILQKAQPKNNIALGKAVNNISQLYADEGKLDKAVQSLKQAIGLYESGGASEGERAFLYGNLGAYYLQQGKYADADVSLNQALSIQQKAINQNPADYAMTLTSLGMLRAGQDKFDEAEKYYNQALAILEKLQGKENPALIRPLHSLVNLYLQTFKFGEAAEVNDRALAIAEKSLGEKHPLYADSIRKKAVIEFTRGRYEESERLFKRAIAIDEGVLGKDTPQVASALVNLAAVYAAQGRFAEAELLYKKSMAIDELVYGPESRQSAEALRELASLEHSKGNFAEAESLYKKAIQIMTKFSGTDSLDVALMQNGLADTYIAQARPVEAEKIYSNVLTQDEKLFGADSAMVAADLDKLASLYRSLGRIGEADVAAKRSSAIKANLPGASPTVIPVPAVVASSAATKPIRDKWALVVGISNYKDSSINLSYPSKDATDFRNYLVNEAGFKADHVKLFVNEQATRDNITGSLGDKWLKALVKPDDLVVIFISSHGSPPKAGAGNTNFIVPYEANWNNIALTGIPMKWLGTGVKQYLKSDRVVLILDVCHAGAATEKNLVRTRDNFDASRVQLGRGELMITSSRANQLSWQSTKYKNSVFTHHLIEGLRRQGKNSNLSKAFQYLQDEVQNEVLRDRAELQTPVWSCNEWQGEIPSLSVPTK